MKVSIITVSFNSAGTIRDSIESVSAQSYPNIEYIVVDGGSTDNTLEIVDEYRGVISKVISERDDGIYDAMNKGVGLATGDIIGVLNSDDSFESAHSIQYVVDAFARLPKVDMVFGDVVFVSPENRAEITRFYSSRGFKPWKLRFGWMPPHPGTYVRREAYEKSGGYSLAYTIAADYEMFVRWFFKYRLTYRRINHVLVRMRQGGISTAGIRSNILLNKEIRFACVSNGLYTNLLFLTFKIPFKLLELIRRPKPEIA
jgi:glycosyltransferase involved in cell wall biosynthesis